MGGRPARALGGDLHALGCHRGAHALQSCDWRHRQGASRPRDRCAGRSDGSRDRCDRHPVQASEPQPRPRRVVSARPGRQAALQRMGQGTAPSRSRTSTGSSCRPTPSSPSVDAFRVCNSRTAACCECRAIVITTGTFLNGLVHVGREQRPSGRAGEPPSNRSRRVAQELWIQLGPAENRHAPAAGSQIHRFFTVPR